MKELIDKYTRDLCSVEFRAKSRTRRLLEEFVKEVKRIPCTKPCICTTCLDAAIVIKERAKQEAYNEMGYGDETFISQISIDPPEYDIEEVI